MNWNWSGYLLRKNESSKSSTENFSSTKNKDGRIFDRLPQSKE